MTKKTKTRLDYDALERKWKRALLRKHDGEWLQSEIACVVFRAMGGSKRRAYRAFTRIGVHASTKSMLLAMWVARGKVPDRDVWLAAGWGGVRRLVDMSARERASKVRELRKEIERGTKPKEAAARILPRPEPRPGSKGRETGPAAAERTPNKVQATLLDTVLEDLVKLARFNPAMLDLCSPETRRAIESRMSGKVG